MKNEILYYLGSSCFPFFFLLYSPYIVFKFLFRQVIGSSFISIS